MNNPGGALSMGTAPLLCVKGEDDISTDIQIDRAELERRVADYTGTMAFRKGLEDIANAYQEIGLPPPRCAGAPAMVEGGEYA